MPRMQEIEANVYAAEPETIAIERSAQVGDLMVALAKAQAEMENPDVDKVNYFRKRYSSKAAVRNAVIPELARQGIATLQLPVYGKGQGWVRCITLLYLGEQYLQSTLECAVVRTRRENDSRASDVIPVAELTHIEYTAV